MFKIYNSVSAGFPSPAEDYLENQLSLDDLVIKHPASTFIVKVEGDSMTEAGVYAGDYLVVDRSLKAKLKDVIVAVLEGEFLVKRLIKEEGAYYLKSEHPDYPKIFINKDSDFMVWGVVIAVIHYPVEL